MSEKVSTFSLDSAKNPFSHNGFMTQVSEMSEIELKSFLYMYILIFIYLNSFKDKSTHFTHFSLFYKGSRTKSTHYFTQKVLIFDDFTHFPGVGLISLG